MTLKKYEEVTFRKLKLELFRELRDSLKGFIKMEMRKIRRSYTPLTHEEGVTSTQVSYVKALEN